MNVISQLIGNFLLDVLLAGDAFIDRLLIPYRKRHISAPQHLVHGLQADRMNSSYNVPLEMLLWLLAHHDHLVAVALSTS
jgi:hypothetical protein